MSQQIKFVRECLGGWNDANSKLDVPCHAWTINEEHLPYKNRPRCYVKSPTVRDVFWPIPVLISCAGVIRRWGLLSHAQNAVKWLALSKRSVEAPQKHVSCMIHDNEYSMPCTYHACSMLHVSYHACFVHVICCACLMHAETSAFQF